MKHLVIKHKESGYLLASLSSLIWAGNYIIARGLYQEVPPITLSFFRWSSATLIFLPFAWKYFKKDLPLLLRQGKYIFIVALLGISLYNTLIYEAGRTVSAIEMALITTTTSPIFSLILAAIFLKERMRFIQLCGLLLCLLGILQLLTKGHWENLIQFNFAQGSYWLVLAALSFAVYNILVRKKPQGLSPYGFLWCLFALGSLLLFPPFLLEQAHTPPIEWHASLIGAILYLGAGNSVIAYICWNAAIHQLGAGRTALFGNLVPVFSSLEAVWLLHEKFTLIHLSGSVLVIGGLILANLRRSSEPDRPIRQAQTQS